MLPSKGALLTQYYGTGHESLDNYVAQISGQEPDPNTQTDCGTYSDFQGTAGGPDGQAVGQGCVYPAGVETLADQLQAAGLTWKGFGITTGGDDGAGHLGYAGAYADYPGPGSFGPDVYTAWQG